ncbi:MAG: outer membrane protein transport protein [Gammaproteobacteria bacterium]
MHNHHGINRRIRAFSIAVLLSFTATGAGAAGFALIEQSVSSMGNAYAGSGAIAQDASTVFFNPASMARLEGNQLSAGLHIVLPNSEFQGSAAVNDPLAAFGADGDPISGSNGGNGGETGVVPHFTYVRAVDERWKVGVGVNVPFGLSTKYNNDWLGRYSATESEIITVNINPTVSFRIDEHASIGFGVSAMYAKLILKNAIDFGLLGGGATGTADGKADLDVDDWGFGFNMGLLLEPTEHTRLSIAYRSKVDVKLDDDVTITGPSPSRQGARADVSLPNTVSLGAYHEVNPRWAIMADITWTQWSKIDALVARFDDGSSNTIPLMWEDTVRTAVGASYKYDDAWTLRTGLAFDESPVLNANFRPAALPDDDRIWLTFGAGYKYSDRLSIDIGYAHLFIDDPQINSTDAASSAVGLPEGLHRLTGEFDADTDIISAQANWKF